MISSAIVEATENHFLALSDEEITSDLERIAAKSEGMISLYDMPESDWGTLGASR